MLLTADFFDSDYNTTTVNLAFDTPQNIDRVSVRCDHLPNLQYASFDGTFLVWIPSNIGATANLQPQLSLLLFPNPATGKLNVRSDRIVTGDEDLRIVCASRPSLYLPSLRRSLQRGNSAWQVDIGTLPSGLYYLWCKGQYAPFVVLQ